MVLAGPTRGRRYRLVMMNGPTRVWVMLDGAGTRPALQIVSGERVDHGLGLGGAGRADTGSAVWVVSGERVDIGLGEWDG